MLIYTQTTAETTQAYSYFKHHMADINFMYIGMQFFISISQIINNECNNKPEQDDCQRKKQETSPEN